MSFVLIARDKPGALELRKANREAHLAYVEATGVVTIAGPLLDDDGNMAGSLLVLDLPDQAAAEAWASEDPYAKAGLFAQVEISGFKRVR
ncbi:MAG: YciI family protein [Pseudomonadota bacterium]